jgi:hypothetical protein
VSTNDVCHSKFINRSLFRTQCAENSLTTALSYFEKNPLPVAIESRCYNFFHVETWNQTEASQTYNLIDTIDKWMLSIRAPFYFSFMTKGRRKKTQKFASRIEEMFTFVSPMRPCLAATYCTQSKPPTRPHEEETLTMRPHPAQHNRRVFQKSTNEFKNLF